MIARGQALRDQSGRIFKLRGTVQDITERKLAEHASQKLAAIVESSDDAIISKDLRGVISSWNAAATRLFGYTPEEAIGQSVRMLIPPELYADEDEILARLQAGQRIEHFVTRRLNRNRERVDVSLTISPIRDSTGRVIGASKIARDIGERMRVERVLLTSEKLASVGRLAATVAHEINNPLESVINLVYLARTATSDATVQGYLSTAEEELNRIAQLTKQTLAFYRGRSERTRVQAGEMLRQLIAVFSSKAQNKALRIDLEIVNDTEILVDLTEFRQLFANLISNSIDACERQGIVRVRVAARGRVASLVPGLRVTVADNGLGIKSADRPHIFEPFFTTKRTSERGSVCGSANRSRRSTAVPFASAVIPGQAGAGPQCSVSCR